MNREGFISSKYWEERYHDGGNSGAGSYKHLAEFKANVLNNYFSRNKIQKVVEYGCGDGNQLSMFNINEYIGYDISSTIIEINKKRFSNDKSKKFIKIDETTIEFENAEVVLSLDVIFYLTEDKVFNQYMNRLFSHPGATCVIIYSTDHNKDRAIHVKDRKITPFIDKMYPQWEMFKSIPNPYGNIPHPHGSSCTFYFYRPRLIF